jgi:hypothetical protein
MRRSSWTLVHAPAAPQQGQGVSPPKHQAKISPGPYKVHTEWGKLMEDSREFKEIKQSCESFSGENATFCWKQERLNSHWSVDERKRFPKEKYPERSTQRLLG